MVKIPILDKQSIDKICSLIRESHSVSVGINDESVGTTSTFSSVRIQEDFKKLESDTEEKINQSIRDALGSAKEANDVINSYIDNEGQLTMLTKENVGSYIGKNVKMIGTGAFSGCSKLKTVSIHSSSKLTKIGDKAFYKCVLLNKITIPKNVTKIGKQAFEECKKLKTITIKSKKLKSVGSKAIKNIHKNATIKCPGKTYVTKYKKLFKSKTGYKKTMKIKK
jgi:hypothetical protein